MARADFETVYAGVRPPRVAILLDTGDQQWQETCRRLMECFSSTWGCKYSVIIPTDGRSISPFFWTLLEAFDPDYICHYQKTGLDWKIALPALYKERLQRELETAFGQ